MELLIMNRDPGKPDDWGVCQAIVKPMEMGWQAALNEVRVDTSAVPDRVYSVDMVETFYDVKGHCINLTPVFVAFFDYEQETRPMLPDVSSMWIDAYEAEKHLPLVRQREVLKVIYHDYFVREPSEELKVYPSRY